jgi:hypothetical protein
MRHLRIPSLPGGALALALLLTPTAAPAQPVADGSTAAESLISRSYAARGGADAWRAVESARFFGTLSMAGRQGEFRVELKAPDQVRVEFEMGEVLHIQVLDGDHGWTQQLGAVMSPVRPLTAAERESLRRQSDFAGPLLDWREKGHRVESLGRRKIGGREYHTLQVTFRDGEVQTIDLDAETLLEGRIEGSREVDGETVEYLQLPEDYREVGGLLFPHALTQHLGNLTQVLEFYSVELNVPIADSRFTAPRN